MWYINFIGEIPVSQSGAPVIYTYRLLWLFLIILLSSIFKKRNLSMPCLVIFIRHCMAMYKNRDTETGNGMRGTRGIGGMLSISSNIPGNVLKHSGACPQTFRGIPSNIPGNVLKHSEECSQTFRGMSPNIPGNVIRYSGECRQTLRGMFSNNPENIRK